MTVFFKKLRKHLYINNYIVSEFDRRLNVYIRCNRHFPFYIRNDVAFSSLVKNKRYFYGNLRLHCCFNYRSRSLLSKLSLSRFGLKQLGGRGLLAGFQKASW